MWTFGFMGCLYRCYRRRLQNAEDLVELLASECRLAEASCYLAGCVPAGLGSLLQA